MTQLNTSKRPQQYEIKGQVEHILGSDRFRAAPAQARLLESVVTMALSDQPIKETTIGARLYPNLATNDGPNVRVVARLLRENLKGYYENEGRHDSVLISFPTPRSGKGVRPLPPGMAYKPIFTYSNAHTKLEDNEGNFHQIRGARSRCFLTRKSIVPAERQ